MGGDREQDLDRELSAHLELEAEEQREAGRTPEEARYAARRALGSTLAIKEDVRATWRWASLEPLRQDLRYAVRVLRKSPGFTAATLFSLAAGIGLNASVFSVLNAALLRPLAAAEPDRLVRIFQGRHGNLSYPNYRDVRDLGTTLESMAAFSWPHPVALSVSTGAGARAEQAWSAAVSANYFDVLGVSAQRGRTFLPDEERAPGAAPVVVLGDALWRGRFGADPAVVGRTVRINGHPFEVIGVAPADVPQPDGLFAHEIWVPATMCGQVGIGDRLPHRRQSWLRTIGRLRPEATVETLRAELGTIARAVEAAAPQDARDLTFTALPETRARFLAVPAARRVAWILQAFVALVLAIACVNIANLQLARSLARGREIATRMAIGAGRGRIVRQFVTESLLLTFAGGLVGLLAAAAGGRLLLRLAPPFPRAVPLALDVAPDGRVVAFGLALSLAIGVVLGVATVLGTLRGGGLSPILKAGDVAARYGAWFAPRRLLVASQVALSAVLLVAAFLFLESLANANRLALGFRPENRLVVSVSPAMQRYEDERIRRLHAEGLQRLRELPGVVSASATIVLPLSGGYLGDGHVWPEGDTESTERGRPTVFFDRVGSGYFATLGATLLRGRDFTETDGPRAPPVAVVNETFARRFWPDAEALGKRFRTGGVTGPRIEIVGVVHDGKYHSLGEEPQPHVYQPLLQGHAPSSFTFVLRTSGDTRGVAAAARATLRQLDPALPITGVQTMEEHLAFAFWGPRVGATLVGVFALLGLALSAAGLYGVLGFLVSRSVPEIGVRMALGASPCDVLWLFLGRGLAMAAGGAALGLLLAAAVARGVSHHLYGVPAWNPAAFGSVAAVLLAVALLACYVPSRRAVKIDPLRALRQD